MKAGTSSLAFWLGAHPEVFLARGRSSTSSTCRPGGNAGSTGTGTSSPEPKEHERSEKRRPATSVIRKRSKASRRPAGCATDRAAARSCRPGLPQYWHNRGSGSETRTFQRMIHEEGSATTSECGVLPRARPIYRSPERPEGALPRRGDHASAVRRPQLRSVPGPSREPARASASTTTSAHRTWARSTTLALRCASLDSGEHRAQAPRAPGSCRRRWRDGATRWNGTGQSKPYPPMDPASPGDPHRAVR